MWKKKWSSIFMILVIIFVGRISHVEASIDELPSNWQIPAKKMLSQEEIDEINDPNIGKGFHAMPGITGGTGTEGRQMIPIRVNTDGFGDDNKFEQYIVFGSLPKVGDNAKEYSRNNFKLLFENDPATQSLVQPAGMYGYKGYIGNRPGSKYGDGYGISYPHIISFLNEDAKKDGSVTFPVTYGHSSGPTISTGYGTSNSSYYDGSGILLTRISDRRQAIYPSGSRAIQGITGFPSATKQEDVFKQSDASKFDFVLFNNEKTNAYIFGTYRIRFSEQTSNAEYLQSEYKELPMVLKIGSTDTYGSVEYSYRFLDESIKDNSNSYTLGYVQHMDIGGVHESSKMRTLGDNRGVYFDAKETDPKIEQPRNLFGDDEKFYNYNVQFNSTNINGEKDKILRTANLKGGPNPIDVGDSKLYPPSWINWIDNMGVHNRTQEYLLVEDEDQPRGEVITRRDSQGKVMNEKNGHPGFGLYFEPQRLSPTNNIAKFDIRGSVTNVPPVNYPSMTLKSAPIKETENKLEPQIIEVEQSLDGNLYSSTRQPGKLDLTFKLDKSIFLTELTNDNVELYLADLDGKNQTPLPTMTETGKKVYDSMIYPYDSNNPSDTSKQSMVLSIYNDFETGSDNIEKNNGKTGFLWRNRENKKIIMRFKTKINEETDRLGPVYEHTKPENYAGEEFKRNFQPKVEVETLWNENISTNVTERVADKKPVFINFESNIYSAKAKKADTLIFGEKDIVKPEQVMESLSRNFDWEKPYNYRFTDANGKSRAIDMTASNAVKTTYVTVESPSLSNTVYKEAAPDIPITTTAVSKPIKVEYYVKKEANSFRRAEIKYIDINTNEVIDIPEGYENVLSGIKATENFKFSVPDEILLPSGTAHYKFEKVVTTPALSTNVILSRGEHQISGKMPNIHNQVFAIQYSRVEGGLSNTIQAEAVPQKFTIGENLERANNPKKWIKNVTKGSETLDESMYDVTIKEDSFVPDVVGKRDDSNSTVSVIVTSKEANTKELELPIPFEAEYGQSIAIGGDEAIVNGNPRLGGGAYTLYPKVGESKSYIRANSGAVLSDDKEPIQSKMLDNYFGIRIYRPETNGETDILNEVSIFDTGEIKGTKKKSDLLNGFGTNRQVEVEAGDVVRVWNKEGDKTYLTTTSPKENLGNEWVKRSEQYFEITDKGYNRLYVNQAVPASKENPILVPYDITEKELDEQVSAFLDLSQIQEKSPTVKVIGFKSINGKVKRPSFKKPEDTSQGLVEVSETLSNGKKITSLYDVFFKATDEKTHMTTTLNYLVQPLDLTKEIELDKAVINNLGEPDFDNKKPKREPKREIDTKKGEKLEPLLSEYNKEFFNYEKSDTYIYLPTDKTLTKIDEKTVVPAEDYMVLFYYDSKQLFELPSAPLSFGKRNSATLGREFALVQNKNEKDNKILVLDTNETKEGKSSWQLRASSEGLHNKESGVRLVANLVFKNPDNSAPIIIANESTPIYESSELYKKDIMLADKKAEEGLFIRVAGHSQLGEYEGKIKYSIGVYP